MNPPIIVLCRGDVTLYTSASAVETHLEPYNVEDNEVYDSSGHLLNCEVQTIPQWWGDRQVIKLIPASPESVHPLELRLGLISFFIHNPDLGEANESLFSCQLQQLIEKIKKVAGVRDERGNYTVD